MTRALKFTFTNSVTSSEDTHDLFSYKSKNDKDQAARVALIFGRNGSGKTTFGRDLFDGLDTGSCNIEMLDGSTHDSLKDDKGRAARLSLFNEDQLQKVRFTEEDNQVHFTEEDDAEGYVTAIFLIDEQKTKYADISSLKEDLGRDQAELEGLTKTIKKLEESQLARARNNIKKSVREKALWHEYHLKATGTQARFREKDFQRLKELCSADADNALLPGLISRREDLLRQVKGAKHKEPVSTQLRDFTLPWLPEHVNGLLGKVPSYQTENFTAKHYMQLLKSSNGPTLFKVVQEVLVSEQAETCPLCTQAVDSDLRKEISLALAEIKSAEERAVLVRDVNTLEKVCVDDLDITDSTQRSAIADDVLESYSESVETLRNLSDKINGLLADKANQPETVFSLPLEEIEKARTRFTTERERVKNELIAYNKAIKAYEENLTEFNEINLQVASQTGDVATAVDEFLQLEQKLQETNSRIKALNGRIPNTKAEIEKLQAASSNETAAVDLINTYLTIVFADPERLSLEPGHGYYRIKVRGKNVRLHSLSTGERNIITLCHFFANMFQGTNDYKEFKEPRFIILDDPVSSFDYENRFGVFQLIRQLIEKFVKNQHTQIVILSHDLGIIQEFAAVMRVIDNASVATRLIDSHELKPLHLEQFSSYDESLRKIYELACSEDPETVELAQLPGGNEMRQVLESFSEFHASVNMADLPKAQIVKASIRSESTALEKYFSGPLYKLLLHGESHSAEMIKSGRRGMTPVFSQRERQLIAKDLVTLIWAIAPAHIPSKLSMNAGGDLKDKYSLNGFEALCLDWASEIENRAL